MTGCGVIVEAVPLFGSVFGAFSWPAAVVVGLAAAAVVVVVAVPLLVVGAVTVVGAACMAVCVGVATGAGAGFYFGAEGGGQAPPGGSQSPGTVTTEPTPLPHVPVTSIAISFLPKEANSNEAAVFQCRVDVHRQNAATSETRVVQRETHRVDESTAEPFYAKCDALLESALRNVASPNGIVVTIYIQPSPGLPTISRLKELVLKHAGEPDVVHRSLADGPE